MDLARQGYPDDDSDEGALDEGFGDEVVEWAVEVGEVDVDDDASDGDGLESRGFQPV
ncbi:hypothetical protein [Actinomyces mediterranea]|uniref:hypothetical protein n=1 Tax=Actinomyces mediterranea TaxID=1871028 RepID=UPI001F2AE883|nr:hypothetical protein [Actinomyces mediterranea]